MSESGFSRKKTNLAGESRKVGRSGSRTFLLCQVDVLALDFAVLNSHVSEVMV